MKKIFENFTFTVLKLNKLIQKIKHVEMREFGLKTIHVMCLYRLYSNRGGLTCGELVKLTLEDKSAISRAVKVLKQKGYANYDSRSYNSLITLTESGVKIAETTLEKADRAVNAASCDFTEEQRLNFYKSLDVIAKKLQAYYDGLTEGKND